MTRWCAVAALLSMCLGASAAQAQDAPRLAVRAQGGWPWYGWRLDIMPRDTLGGFAEMDIALGNRWQPSLGVRWSPLREGRSALNLELSAGAQYQRGTLAQRGPSLKARVRGRWGETLFGYGWLGSRHTLLFDQIRVQTRGGVEASTRVTHLWTPSLAIGGGWQISRAWSVAIGLDMRFADVGVTFLSLPGLHVLIDWAGG